MNILSCTQIRSRYSMQYIYIYICIIIACSFCMVLEKYDTPRTTNNLNIFQLIEYYASIFMFQKLNSTVPNVFQHNRFLSYSYHTYETRNNLSIITPLFKLQISRKSIFDHGIKIWNNLSPEIKSITNKSKFRKIVRKKAY